MIHPRLAFVALCVVTLSHPLCAAAATKRLTSEEKACAVSRAQVTRFLTLDLRGARRSSDPEVRNLVAEPEPPRLRPLAVTREREIVACTAKERATSTSVRVRYQVVGIVQRPPENSNVSVYLPGKGSHDRVFKLAGSKATFRITNAGEIIPHVSPEVAVEELRKELALAKDDIERGSIEGAIAEIERQ